MGLAIVSPVHFEVEFAPAMGAAQHWLAAAGASRAEIDIVMPNSLPINLVTGNLAQGRR